MPHTLHLIRNTLSEVEASMKRHLDESRRILSQPPVKVYRVFRAEVKKADGATEGSNG